MTHHYGWLPDIPSLLDWKLPSAVGPPPLLPSSVDLTSQCPPIFNQGALGSCTANAGDALWMFLDQKQGGQNLIPSRLALYYWARERQGWQASDTGAFLRDTLAVLATIGAAPETDWPYDINKFTQKPPQKAYDDAASYKALAYMRVGQTLDQMKQCLASGYPLAIGFTVYENFETAEVTRTGIAQMPQGKVLGGHAVLVTGYDDATRRFKVRNSWGKEWGMEGSFTIPYEYFTDSSLSDDLWTIRSVAEVIPTPPPPVPPDPDAPPSITKITYVRKSKLKVVGTNFSEDAVLFLDGDPTDAPCDAGRFIYKKAGLTGTHTIGVLNPNGLSDSRHFTV